MRRNTLLDVCRLVAITLVVLGHAAMAANLTWGSVLWDNGVYDVSLGQIGVTLFIILSGASLHLRQPRSIREFYMRRIIRIYPTYWIALLVALAVGAVTKHIPWPENGLDTVLTITGFCAFAGHWGCQTLPMGWFIGVIVALYVLYPWIASTVWRWPTYTLLMSAVLSVSTRLLVADNLPYHPSDWFPMCRLFEFVLGIYLVDQQWLPTWQAPQSVQSIISTLAQVSFPVYLIHWMFLPAFWHWGFPTNVLAFVTLTGLVSMMVFKLDCLLYPTRGINSQTVPCTTTVPAPANL